MQEGLSSKQALDVSNSIKVSKNFHLNTKEFNDGMKERLTNQTIQNIKHDTEALTRMSDLRNHEASAVRIPGNKGCANTKVLAKERKYAQQTIQEITEAECAANLEDPQPLTIHTKSR